ncbi:MAG: hypothetical protein NUW24_06585 [Anaerolineae bacterium]|nr:hypothetical protein [Anaerolineae bacterium]MDH7472782.1 hypothetical protein [Anaerolineae bacterium]
MKHVSLARRADAPTRLGHYDLPIDVGLTPALGLCVIANEDERD